MSPCFRQLSIHLKPTIQILAATALTNFIVWSLMWFLSFVCITRWVTAGVKTELYVARFLEHSDFIFMTYKLHAYINEMKHKE